MDRRWSEKEDILIGKELDVDISGENIFSIRPEISPKILTLDSWQASIHPKLFQNPPGDYPWISIDKTRVEVPQTNLAFRAVHHADTTPAGEILRKPPVSVPLVKHHVRYNKLMYDMYERYDPARGNCMDVGQVDAKQSFLAFPCGESQSLLSISPMAICQIYPTESESDTHNILSVDDVEMRHNARASIDVHSPIRQITNIDPFGSGQPNSFVGVRTLGGAAIVKVMPNTEDTGSKPFKIAAPAAVAFHHKDITFTNITAVDMASNPYYQGECIFAADNGYFGLWNYETKPRAMLDDLTILRSGGPSDQQVSHQWHSCKYASHPRLLYTAYPYQLDLCDLRAKPGSNTSLIFNMRNPLENTNKNSFEDNICALAVPPSKHPFEVAIADNSRIQLFDIRFPNQCVLTWQHHMMQFKPSQLEYVTDQVNGCDTAHILAWNAHSKSAHVFEYGKTDSLSGDIFHTVDMSYNAEPLMSQPIPTSHYNNRSNQGGSYYVAPRQIYALPTCRYRPAHSAWVAPFPKGKTEHFRENPPLAGIKVLPGIAGLMKHSESESRPPYARSWCVLQLCYDGSVRSKVWCRRRNERDDVRALKCFHRPPTGFDDLQVEHLDTVQKEIELETRHVDMSSVFEDLNFNGEIHDVKEADIDELESAVIKSVKASTVPKTLYEILQEDGIKDIGHINDEHLRELEKRLQSSKAVHERKVWHNSIEEFGLTDPVSLDLGDRIKEVITKLNDVCYVEPDAGHHGANADAMGKQTSYISEAIRTIATDITTARHIIGNQPEEIDVPSESNNLVFPHLFNSEQCEQRRTLDLNAAANALASDWDINADPSSYSFRRLDGLTMDEVLHNQQAATSSKKRRRKSVTQFAVQSSQSHVPEVIEASSKKDAPAVTASMPSMSDLDFSTQWAQPSPESKKTRNHITSASQPVPGPFGSRIKPKKKKKRSQGF